MEATAVSPSPLGRRTPSPKKSPNHDKISERLDHRYTGKVKKLVAGAMACVLLSAAMFLYIDDQHARDHPSLVLSSSPEIKTAAVEKKEPVSSSGSSPDRGATAVKKKTSRRLTKKQQGVVEGKLSSLLEPRSLVKNVGMIRATDKGGADKKMTTNKGASKQPLLKRLSQPNKKMLSSGGAPSMNAADSNMGGGLRQQAEENHSIPEALKQRLKNMFFRPDLIVVFGDYQYLDFVLNSHASFVKNAPQGTARAQYLVVGMDDRIVQECNKRGIRALLYSDILLPEEKKNLPAATPADKNTAASSTADDTDYLANLRCTRMEVVIQLQKAGFNVLLLDSDIVLTAEFDMLAYMSQLDVDFTSGHGTFPLDMYNLHGFALQSGFYYVRANQAGKDMMVAATEMCHQVGDGQITLNQYVMSNFETIEPRQVLPSSSSASTGDSGNAGRSTDNLGTQIFSARTSDYRGTGKEAELRLAILGKTFFPTGCKFVNVAHPNAKVRHPGCTVSAKYMPMDRRIVKKIKSLEDQNAWFLELPPKKAIFWSYPGSGNTMLRYSYEQITGKVGSTNSFYYDRRLSPVLPGEGSLQGSILKMHPIIATKAEVSQRLEHVLAESKRVILMRDPFDAVWSWYQLLQTNSHVRHMKQQDFSPNHFALRALEMAEAYRRAVEEDLGPFVREHPEKAMVLKFEELVENQDTMLRKLLEFLDEDVAGIEKTDLRLRSHHLIRRDSVTDEYQTKAAAFGSTKGLVDQMWQILEKSASLYGYSKPNYVVESDSASNLLVLPSRSGPRKLPPIHKNRYLTYTPTGGLTNQLLELESAVQLAQMSGRTLVLPPLLAEAVALLPGLWTDLNSARVCKGTIGASETTCGLNIENTEKFVWSKVLNMTHLSSRVDIVEEIPQEVAPLMSKLSLCEYHKCNTRWLLDSDAFDDTGCLPDYTQEFRPQNSDTILRRSARCVFQFSGNINILEFGGIIDSFANGPFVPQVRFHDSIVAAAEVMSDRIRTDVSDNGEYACAQLRLGGASWESQSPHIAERERHFQRILDFLRRKAIDKKMPLYIATDNEALVRARADLCGERKCLFPSDFTDVQTQYGISHFQELIPVDYLVCSSADHVEVSKGSSFGWFIENLHYNLQLGDVEADAVSSAGHLSVLRSTSKYAYVLLLGNNPDKLQYSTYVTATRALIHSLRESGSKADIVVMMVQGNSATKSLLEQDGAIVVEVEPVLLKKSKPGELDVFEDWFGEITLAKIHAFSLTQYSRFQFLDSDVVLLDGFNLDHLFEYQPDAQMVTEGLGPESPIRSGWFMSSPSKDTYEALSGLVHRGRFTEMLGWDELGLPVNYPGWNYSDMKGTSDAGAWGFYGASLEQGLFYHHFYALPNSEESSLGSTEGKGLNFEVFDDDKMRSLGMVHCYGDRKPWNAELDEERMPEVLQAAHLRWNQILGSLKERDEFPVARIYHNPLTATGRRQLVPFLYYDSQHPSSVPSVAPSTTPSHVPTAAPSSAPSSSPSGAPSSAPSSTPTISPLRDCDNLAGASFDVAGSRIDCQQFTLLSQTGIDEQCADSASPASKLCFSDCSTCLTRRAQSTGTGDQRIGDCRDLSDVYFQNTDGEAKECSWLRGLSDESRRDANCATGNPAYHICEHTCGKCRSVCEDDDTVALPAYQTSPQQQGTAGTCSALAALTRDQDDACAVSEIRDTCKHTCNYCPEIFPSDMPSAVPSLQPSADLFCDDNLEVLFIPVNGTLEGCMWLMGRNQSEVDALCVQGSQAYNLCEETCGKCIDFCQDNQTAILPPYDATSGIPATNCSDLSVRPEDFGAACAVQEISDLCQDVCNSCLHPSTMPSSAPSMMPSDNCDDDHFASFVVPGSDEVKGCSWLKPRVGTFVASTLEFADTDTNTDYSNMTWGALLCSPNNETGVAYHICEETCGKCFDGCEDDDTREFETAPGSGEFYGCSWLRSNPRNFDLFCKTANDITERNGPAAFVCYESCETCSRADSSDGL